MLEKIVIPLLDWYAENKRMLPWREAAEPYHVWISEIMLQQTRVEAVKEYYVRFMEQLPEIQDLAKVPQERLLKLWEGLGYYNRARNLQKAAQIICEEYEGRMPSSYEELLALPGIGHYTAGAIASIAYGKPEPAVDGNVLRVLTRVTADLSDITKESFKQQMRNDLRAVIPKDQPGDFNQALMDLGAMICVPSGRPHCEACPWEAFCQARIQGEVARYPYKPEKKKRRVEEKTVLILQGKEHILLHKRAATGLLAGMYEFPLLDGAQEKDGVIHFLEQNGLYPLQIVRIEDSKHIFSHVEWHMRAYQVRLDELRLEEVLASSLEGRQYYWVNHKMVETAFPIPSAFTAYKKYITDC